MYGSVNIKKKAISMDQSDIKYILELLNEALATRNWDGIYETLEAVKEFVDSPDNISSELE